MEACGVLEINQLGPIKSSRIFSVSRLVDKIDTRGQSINKNVVLFLPFFFPSLSLSLSYSRKNNLRFFASNRLMDGIIGERAGCRERINIDR